MKHAVNFFIALMLVFIGMLYWGPGLEGKYLPVASVTNIVEVKETGNEEVEIFLQFKKVRNCEYKQLSWYIVDPVSGDLNLVPWLSVELGGNRGVSRPTGPTTTGPWRIGMSKLDFEQHSLAVAKHQCHFLWPTISNFYEAGT